MNNSLALIIPVTILDCLLTIRTSIKLFSAAITETANPHLRTALHDQLDAAVHLHGELSDLLLEKGWLLGKPVQINSHLLCNELS